MADQVIITTDNNTGLTAEQKAAEAAALEKATGTKAPEAPETSELIMGKYKDQDALIAAFKELQAKDTRSNQGTAEATEPEKNETATEEKNDKSGLDFDVYTKEFAETGNLSDASRKSITDSGIPSEMIDMYLAGLRATKESHTTALNNKAGGAEQLNVMVNWANQNLSEIELNALDKAFKGTAESQLLGVSDLRLKYEAANGVTPNLISGDGSIPASSYGYKDQTELQVDINNPLHRAQGAEGDAFRAKVMAKLKKSNFSTKKV